MAARDDDTPDLTVAAFLAAHPGLAGQRIGIAVSGGSDSIALLRATRACLPPDRLRVATVDHGLRPAAQEEACFVQQIAQDSGVVADVLTLDLADGPAMPDRARTARYGALADWARDHGVAVVLIGHTQDDVAETLAMRLRRGVGLDGLSAMPAIWRDDGGTVFARPLLNHGRAALRDWLTTLGQGWIDDPTNDDTRYERAATRQAMMDLGWDTAPLARSAAALSDAADAIAHQTAQVADVAVTEDRGDLLFDPVRLPFRNAAVERRLWAAMLAFVGGAPQPRAAELGALLDLPPDAPRRSLAGCLVTSIGTIRRISREPAACPAPQPIGTPWDRRWCIAGPDSPGLTVGALGDDIAGLDWRACGLPRLSAMATPAVRDGTQLIAAPVIAGHPKWSATRIGPRLSATIRPDHSFFN